MADAITVRDLKADDRSRWEELFRGYIAFYKAEIPETQYDVTFKRLLSDEPGTHHGFIAADDNDRPIGLAHVLLHRSTWSPTGYVYLEDLFVDPTVRGTGAGRALIHATYAFADAQGATRTYWATQDFNAQARHLYDQLATLSPFVQYRR